MKKSHKSINLIPTSRRKGIAVPTDFLLVLGIFLVTALGSWNYYSGSRRVKNLQTKLDLVVSQEFKLEKSISELKSNISVSAAKGEQGKLVKKVIGQKLEWPDIFKELGLIIPKRTWLTEMMAKNVGGRLAVSMNGKTVSQAHMADFYTSLEKSEYFSNVLVLSSKITDKTQPPLYLFEFASPNIGASKIADSQGGKK